MWDTTVCDISNPEPKDLFKHLLESAICHQQHCTGVCDQVFVDITSRAMVWTVGMVVVKTVASDRDEVSQAGPTELVLALRACIEC